MNTMTKITLMAWVILLNSNPLFGMIVTDHVQQKYQETCNRVARYYIKHVPSMKLSEAYDTFHKLHNPVKLLISEHAVDKQLPTLMLLTVPKDIFFSVLQSYIPQSEIQQRVNLEDSLYFGYKKGYAERKQLALFVPIAKKTDSSIEIIPIPQHKIFDLNTIDAFSILSEYENQKPIEVNDLIEDPSNIKDSLCSGRDFYFQDETLTKSYRQKT